MTTHQMKLAKIPFEKLKNGAKIIESRLFDEKRQHIRIGDRIEFVQNDDPHQKVVTRVKNLYKYATFEELFSSFPPEYFGGDTKKNLLQEIHRFYSSEKEFKCGVVGIRIEHDNPCTEGAVADTGLQAKAIFTGLEF